MATARRTRVCFSPASRRPRSANTLPELRTIASLFLPLAISRLVIRARCLESPRNQLHIRLGCLYTRRRLFLERMQHIRGVRELYCIHCPVGLASVILHDFKDPRAFSLPRLRLRVLPTELRNA